MQQITLKQIKEGAELQTLIDAGAAVIASVTGEVATGVLNGVNATFTSAFSFKPESLEVFRNGQRLNLSVDYSITGSTQVNAFFSPISTEKITFNYIKA